MRCDMASISMRIKFVLVTILVFVLAVAAGVAGAASPVPGDDVETGDLARLIDKADRVVVLQGPRPGAAVLYESSRRNDIDALRAAMAVNRPGRYLHCMCDGTPTLVFYSQGKIIGQVSNHHAHLIRYNLWRSDALLAKPEALLKWFDDRKIAEPRKEY